MKTRLGELLKIVMYTIFGIMFVMASYIIILNIHHQKSLIADVAVSELDSDYAKYKENVVLIEEMLSEHKDATDDSIYGSLSIVLNNMKKDGVFRLIPKNKLSYKDLYELNDYFIEELINKSWIYKINDLEISKKYHNIITMLINNANYLNSVFKSNSLALFDSNLDNKIDDNYHFILSNYLMYSDVILNMCNELGGANGEIN